MKVFVAYPTFAEYVQKIFSDPKDVVLVNTENARYRDVRFSQLVIFMGGEDVHPHTYRANPKFPGISYYNVVRDQTENEVFQQAYEHHIPMLGICRGHQLINALMGGNMIQDIFWEYEGKSHGSHHPLQHVENDPILNIFNHVNSMHHQAVNRIGRGLRIVSTHDGIVEATKGEGIYTVQYHPEFMWNSKLPQAYKFWDEIKKWASTYERRPEQIIPNPYDRFIFAEDEEEEYEEDDD